MKDKIRTNFILFVASILTPFLGTIFLNPFLGGWGIFILLPLFFISLISLIVSTNGLRKTQPNKQKRIRYSVVAFSSVLIFILTYCYQVDIADYISFKINQDNLNEFVTNIKTYKKITQLSDEYENLNGYPTITKNNTNIFIELGDHYPIEEIKTKFSIDNKHYEIFRQSLKTIGYRSFCILADGTISFTQGGMIDNCFGIAYSETGSKPTENDCGRIVKWTKISNHWYAWATT